VPERSKRHHYVPQLLLKGFADGADNVATMDRRNSRSFVQPILTAAAENDYNTIRDADGSPSDMAEKAMSQFEGAAAAAIDRMRGRGWLEGSDERSHVARLIALQYLRVPRQREFSSAIASTIAKLQIAGGGPAAIRSEMESRGLQPTDDDVLAEWERIANFDSWDVEVPTEHHLAQNFSMVDEVAEILYAGFHWTVAHWTRRALLTSDHPVVLEAAPDHPEWSGVGVATAGTILLAIGRRTALVLTHRAELERAGKLDLPEGIALAGSFSLARDLNQRTALQARRWLYHHPDEVPSDLLGRFFELPPPPKHVLDPETGTDLRDNLRSVAEWAFKNPEKPHPFTRLPAPPAPPPDARPPVFDGRGQRWRAVDDRIAELRATTPEPTLQREDGPPRTSEERRR
jgi:hypothetical protein